MAAAIDRVALWRSGGGGIEEMARNGVAGPKQAKS